MKADLIPLAVHWQLQILRNIQHLCTMYLPTTYEKRKKNANQLYIIMVVNGLSNLVYILSHTVSCNIIEYLRQNISFDVLIPPACIQLQRTSALYVVDALVYTHHQL